jgi:hypothetical protein
MSAFALVLVLLAAVSHASWNISAKFAAEAHISSGCSPRVPCSSMDPS